LSQGACPGPADVPITEQWDLRTAFDHAPIGIAVLTPTGVIITGNRALENLLCRPVAALAGTTFFDVTHPDDLPAAWDNCRLMQDGRTSIVRHECRFVRPDDSVVWVSVSTARVPAAAGRAAHLIMHVEDVDDRKALEARLAHLALHDPLTGLGNRALLDEAVDRALAAGGPPRCLLFLDLDGFKSVNDRYGHSAGDALLRQLAVRIATLTAPGDTVARLGGDEFVVLCGDGGTDRGTLLAGRLRAAAARPFVVDGHLVRLTAAVGMSTTEEGNLLLPAADRRMYEQKQRRR
jgi:diguanylate cyclase (GGDEF)-like protein/PAS domain S-box-containing protein